METFSRTGRPRFTFAERDNERNEFEFTGEIFGKVRGSAVFFFFVCSFVSLRFRRARRRVGKINGRPRTGRQHLPNRTGRLYKDIVRENGGRLSDRRGGTKTAVGRLAGRLLRGRIRPFRIPGKAVRSLRGGRTRKHRWWRNETSRVVVGTCGPRADELENFGTVRGVSRQTGGNGQWSRSIDRR